MHAAEGYARSTGKVGVVLVTSGPGATNAVTGLTDALMDQIPVVCITGQVPTHLIGNDAFQECDTVGITRPCTKHNWLVKRDRGPAARPARGVLCRAHRPAGPGGGRYPEGHPVRHRHLRRPGRTSSTRPIGRASKAEPRAHQGGRRADGVSAKKPLFYTGGGVINSGPRSEPGCCASWSKLTGFPITSTLMGLGAYPAAGQELARHARHARHLRGQPGRCTTAT